MLKQTSLILSVMILSSCSSGFLNKNKNKATAEAQISSPQKNVAGNVTFKETKKGIKVSAEVSGLKPGSVHGIHIHENGKCEAPGFKSAGGHFNPDSSPHAGPAALEKHIGDFGNIIADENGVAKKEILIEKDTVENLDTIMNKAIIVHAGADDLRSQPSGNSGDRMACGVIRPSKG